MKQQAVPVWEDITSYPMSLLADQISQPLCVFTSAGRIVNMNHAFSHLFYMDTVALSQENFYTLFDIWECDFAALTEGESINLYDKNMVLFDKSRCPVDAIIGCLKDSSEMEMGIFYALVTNLSERHAHEKLKQKIYVMSKQRALSAELHDHIAQHLTLLKMRYADVRASLDSLAPQKSVEDCDHIIDMCLSEIRSVIHQLRAGEDMVPNLTLENHQDLIAFARDMLDLKIYESQLENFSLMDAAHYRAACFVLRESLTNVWKHAKTKEAWVKLTQNEQGLLLMIEDKGCGISPKKTTGLGLQILQEKLNRQRIQFSVNSIPNKGTTIRVQLNNKIRTISA